MRPRAAARARDPSVPVCRDQIGVGEWIATLLYTWPMVDDSKRAVRIRHLRERGGERDLGSATPAERLSMVWLVTLDAWAFKDESVAESRLQRHSVRVLRGGG